MPIPQHVSEEIAEHLDAIGSFFKNPKVTLIVRNPGMDDADLILTQDSADEIRKVIDRTYRPEREGEAV